VTSGEGPEVPPLLEGAEPLHVSLTFSVQRGGVRA